MKKYFYYEHLKSRPFRLVSAIVPQKCKSFFQLCASIYSKITICSTCTGQAVLQPATAEWHFRLKSNPVRHLWVTKGWTLRVFILKCMMVVDLQQENRQWKYTIVILVKADNHVAWCNHLIKHSKEYCFHVSLYNHFPIQKNSHFPRSSSQPSGTEQHSAERRKHISSSPCYTATIPCSPDSVRTTINQNIILTLGCNLELCEEKCLNLFNSGQQVRLA